MNDFTFTSERCLIGSVYSEETAYSDLEIKELCRTLGLQVCSSIAQARKSFDPATCFGTGKVEEMKEIVEEKKIDLVVIDTDLTATQIRNLENLLQKPVLDRAGVILQIFSNHARSKEAKLQVEMAKFEYLLPRLTRYWTHLGRQRGGIGLKGEGEKQIEIDRRIIKDSISGLQKKLEQIKIERNTRRRGRDRFIQAGLVGYTNAGKSTLLNILTQSEVLTEDKLFATLDTSLRSFSPVSRPPILLLDTVGFISRLPPQLMASFRSTLEELNNVDLLLHVVDASNPQWKEHVEIVENILDEILTEPKERILIFNKIDLCDNTNFLKVYGRKKVNEKQYLKFLLCSAIDKTTLKEFREEAIRTFDYLLRDYDVLIPYDQGKVIAQIFETCQILTRNDLDQGIFFRVKCLPSVFTSFGFEKFLTGTPDQN